MKTSGGADFAVLDFLLWGFLNTNLEGEAWNLLESVEGQQGFEVWRRLVRDIIRKSPVECVFPEQKVMRRPECKHYSDVPKALQDFELDLQRWYSVGGRRLSAEEESGQIMRVLPKQLKRQAYLGSS